MKKLLMVAVVATSIAAQAQAGVFDNANLKQSATYLAVDSLCGVNGARMASLRHMGMGMIEEGIASDLAASLVVEEAKRITTFVISGGRTEKFCRNGRKDVAKLMSWWRP